MNTLKLLLQISLRNIFSNFLTVIVGMIILVGTVFFVVGGSMVTSIDRTMSQSIINSAAGNIQVYSAGSTDLPNIYPAIFLPPPDLEPIPDFLKIKDALLQNRNIKSIIPECVNNALVMYGNSIDRALEKLRNAESRNSHASKKTIESLKAHVRQMVAVIKEDMTTYNKISRKGTVDIQSYNDLEKADSGGFWNSFDSDPLNHLEFLENKIAYLIPDAETISLSYLATDLDSFKQNFNRLQIIDGEFVPQGHRGMLISKYIYENEFKLKNAHRLDLIKEAIEINHKKISKDPDLKEMVRLNSKQIKEIIFQLDPVTTGKMVSVLQSALLTDEKDISKLLSNFFDMNDDNFKSRYEIFYSRMAPMLDIYLLKPGDILTIQAYTKTGFMESVNVKIYGTYQFKGFEKSNLAGASCLMDLFSFRDLYGYVTPGEVAEAKELEKAAGTGFIKRNDAESELFGGTTSVGTAQEKPIDVKAIIGNNVKKKEGYINRVYSQNEMEKGVVLEAAVFLKDASGQKQTMKELQQLSNKENLGLKVITGQKAAGVLGQLLMVIKFILYFATAVIFLVALIVINSAVVMATLQRVREIGTLRAIGAQKTFVILMILTETVLLGLVFGSAGAIIGSALVAWLGSAGIPAVNDNLYFFFSGPRLFPALDAGSLIGSFLTIILVTCASALYPAFIATKVSPITAITMED